MAQPDSKKISIHEILVYAAHNQFYCTNQHLVGLLTVCLDATRQFYQNRAALSETEKNIKAQAMRQSLDGLWYLFRNAYRDQVNINEATDILTELSDHLTLAVYKAGFNEEWLRNAMQYSRQVEESRERRLYTQCYCTGHGHCRDSSPKGTQAKLTDGPEVPVEGPSEVPLEETGTK